MSLSVLGGEGAREAEIEENSEEVYGTKTGERGWSRRGEKEGRTRRVETMRTDSGKKDKKPDTGRLGYHFSALSILRRLPVSLLSLFQE